MSKEWEDYLRKLIETEPMPLCRKEDEEGWCGWTYKEAVEYLKLINQWDSVKDRDGYEIIATARYLKSKEIKKKLLRLRKD